MSRCFLQTVRGADGCRSVHTSVKSTPLGALESLYRSRHSLVSVRPSPPDATRRRLTSWLTTLRDTISSPLPSPPPTDAAAQMHKLDPDEAQETSSDNCSALPENRTPDISVDALPHVSSMRKFCVFLSSQETPRIYTIRGIRSRYTLWASQRVLHDLGSQDMSSLIRLLGTLSTAVFGQPLDGLHTHPRALQMPFNSFAPHWDLISHIVAHKRWLRYPLYPSDHYWLLRGELTRFWEHQNSDPTKADRALKEAEKHHQALAEHSSHPGVHIPYFHALIASSSSKSVVALLSGILRVFAQRRPCHSSIVDVFFRAIIQYRDVIPLASRREVLYVIAHKVNTKQEELAAADAGESSYLRPSRPISDSLLLAFEHAIFAPAIVQPSRSAQLDPRLICWGKTVASHVFALGQDSTDSVDLPWNCLVQLALARTRALESRSQPAETAHDLIQHTAMLEWQTICALFTLESAIESTSGPSFTKDVLQGLIRFVRRSWSQWITAVSSNAPSRPKLASRLVCASFLKLAGLLKDRALVDACRQFCLSADLWSDQSITEPGLQTLAAEQFYASLVCGTFFERALVDLMVVTDRLRTIRHAIDTAILRYSFSEPERAQELVMWSINRGVVPTDSVAAAVGVAFAQHGISQYLERYMTDSRLAPKHRARIFVAHMRAYARYGSRFMSLNRAIEATRQACEVAGQLEDPAWLLRRLQSSFLAIIRRQHAPQVFELIEDVVHRHSSLFTSSFYTPILRTLLHHGHYRLAQRFFDLCLMNHPEMAKQWSPLVLSGFARGGARRLVSASTGHIREAMSSPSFRQARAVRFLSRTPPNARTLALDRERRKSADPTEPHAVLYAVRLLVRARRLLAAKRLFAAVHARAPPTLRTALANAILHGYLRRPRQQPRTVLRAYAVLCSDTDFVPDHGTVRVLVRAHLLPRAKMDATAVRKLFDDLVRSGYPDGSGTKAARETLGAGAAIRIGDFELPRVERPLKLARDVVPLYRAFVTALYKLGDIAAARKVIGIWKALQEERWVDPRWGEENSRDTRW